jgi:hypothetical protein
LAGFFLKSVKVSCEGGIRSKAQGQPQEWRVPIQLRSTRTDLEVAVVGGLHVDILGVARLLLAF